MKMSFVSHAHFALSDAQMHTAIVLMKMLNLLNGDIDIDIQEEISFNWNVKTFLNI